MIRSPYIHRRSFLRLAGGTASLMAAPALVSCVDGSGPKVDPFSLGVASGDPSPDGFVLWTRLAPDPLTLDPKTVGGMTGGDVPVQYEIATDPNLRTIVRRGAATAEARYAWSVHAEVAGLEPGRPYWYRFVQGAASSRIGRAMTAPAVGSPLDKFRFAFVSCSNYEHGYFSAYRHLTEERPDCVIFLGDYIYEGVYKAGPTVRQHYQARVADDLWGYRSRYAQYRLDPNLQNLHAEIPALMTWDDHEVQNDYADDFSETFDDPQKFLLRRAAAYQAFYEHMPVRPSLSMPHGPAMRVYDRFAFGDLVEFSVVDGRQYRSHQACYAKPNHGGGHLETRESCAELFDPKRSYLGMEQERWLYDGFTRSRARWNVLAQDMLMSELRRPQPNGQTGFWTDDWNGYPAARQRLLQHMRDSKLSNPVVIGGDIHSFWTNDLKLDTKNPKAPTIATEVVGTSITSYPGPYDYFVKLMPENPQVRFFDSRKRGYAMVEVTCDRMITKFQAISDGHDPNATLSTLKSFVVENGIPGAVTA